MPNQSIFSDTSPINSDRGANLIGEISEYTEPSPSRMGELEITQFLRSLDEFLQIPIAEVATLARASRLVTLQAGECITNEGDDESANGFIVVSGCMAMIKTSLSGKELIVELLQNGDIFGVLLMLAKEKVPAQLTARSIGISRILLVPTKTFSHLLKAHAELFEDFVAHLLLCLQSSYCLSRGLAYDRVETRIAAVLSSLAVKFGKSAARKESRAIYFTRQQLAELTGTTPETAIRVTRSMQREGLIDISRPGIIRILNSEGLHELALG